MSLDELKEAALKAGYSRIQREEENAPIVDLRTWNGFSSHVIGHMYATVEYYLEGNRVCIHKTLEREDHWYLLS